MSTTWVIVKCSNSVLWLHLECDHLPEIWWCLPETWVIVKWSSQELGVFLTPSVFEGLQTWVPLDFVNSELVLHCENQYFYYFLYFFKHFSTSILMLIVVLLIIKTNIEFYLFYFNLLTLIFSLKIIQKHARWILKESSIGTFIRESIFPVVHPYLHALLVVNLTALSRYLVFSGFIRHFYR